MLRSLTWSASRRATSILLAASAALLLVLVLPSGSHAQATSEYTPGEEQPEDFPEGPGRDEAFYACIACHNFKLVAAQGMSRARWDETINFMIERHNMPPVDSADRERILDYLSKAFPERARRGWQNPFTQ
jgi:hypothetical protein